MPIRPEMKKLYPPPKEWKAIRERILARAEHRCECCGECGLRHFNGQCIVPDKKRVERSRESNGSVSWSVTWPPTPRSVHIVLTTAHLDHDPTNNDEANLRAFCQLCHLRYDRHEHAKNAANTRRRKADEASGQVALFGGNKR